MWTLYSRLLVVGSFMWSCHSQRDSGVLQTSHGKVLGLTINLGLKSVPPVTKYLGIPYGAAPEGKGRFLPPQNAPKWGRTTKDATQLPPVCLQNFPEMSDPDKMLAYMPRERYEYLKRYKELIKDQREDCLNMNIFVPTSARGSLTEKFPVLLIIHGESYEWGTGNAYDPTVLSGYGQIIVVTINFRQAALGYLSSGDPIVSGNRAMHDILAAVLTFHGIGQDFRMDTSRITLMGFGTGAAVVNLLMAAPPSLPSDIHLFHRAIVLGGSALSKWAVVPNPREFFYIFAEKAGCSTIGQNKFGSEEFLSPAQVLVCLQQLPLANITRAQKEMPHPTYLSTFGPVLDGIFVVKQPEDNMMRHGNLFHRYDLLLGVNKFEGFNLASEKDTKEGITQVRRDKILRTLVRNLFQFHRTEIFEAVVNEYTDWANPSSEPPKVLQETLAAVSDCLYTAPIVQTAQLHANNDDSPTPQSRTFLYSFAPQTKTEGLKATLTNEDLPYILGYPLINQDYQGQLNIPFTLGTHSQKEKFISEMMMRYVSNFVKSGDPNKPIELGNFITDGFKVDEKVKFDVWPSFDGPEKREKFFAIGERPKSSQYLRAQQVAFWTKFLPRINRQFGAPVEDEHHFLPDHKEISSFFGEVFPLGGYFSAPFTPPPLPPPQMPKELMDKLSEQRAKPNPMPTTTEAPKPSAKPIEAGGYSTILSVTVAVGCALLILNILVFAGIYHQKDKQKRRKKQQLQQSHYNTSAPHLNSPIGRQPQLSPPAPLNSVKKLSDAQPLPTLSDSNLSPRGGLGIAEFEPLLTRPISNPPLCARHGRSPVRTTMEEIQV